MFTTNGIIDHHGARKWDMKNSISIILIACFLSIKIQYSNKTSWMNYGVRNLFLVLLETFLAFMYKTVGTFPELRTIPTKCRNKI